MKPDDILRNPAALAAVLRGDIGNAMIAATPGGIEAQEKAGQAQLVAKGLIPRRIAIASFHDTEAGRAAAARGLAILNGWGITLADSADPLFYSATLPAGWTIRPTSHDMRSELVDERGRVRAGLFYKAAFYDRRADTHIKTRFAPSTTNVDPDDYQSPDVATVSDAGVEIWRSGPLRSLDAAWAAAKAWLNEYRPNWEDGAAYWDEP